MNDLPTTPLKRAQDLLGTRYHVQREIGMGGTATVFLARDIERDCDVAVKVLRPEFIRAVSAERFVQEVRIAKQLQHPNILPVFEFGNVGGEMFYTMPFIDGKTLRDRLQREKQLKLAEALSITRQIAAALECAHNHARPIVHRDIKPANILLDGDQVYVADFGIARPIEVKPGDTQPVRTDTGIALGTAEYMSPEQCSAQRDLDGRTDQYALACVLFEMLAGDPPFTGNDSAAIHARHRLEPPRSIRIVRPAVPLGVERAIEKALAKQRVDRYDTVREFIDALEADVPIEVLNPHRQRKRRVLAGAGILVAVAVTLLLAARGSLGSVGDRLLLLDRPHTSRPAGNAGTKSLRARRAFLQGQVALEQGSFDRADSAFFNATRIDPDYAQALTWLALIRYWIESKDRPFEQFTDQAALAVASRGALARPDSLILAALIASASRQADVACGIWSRLTTDNQFDYAAWYGSATCLQRDHVVVRDEASPSGWRFRTSCEQALRAYEQAFRLRPSLLSGYGGRSLAKLQELFYTGAARNRSGRALGPDTTRFLAFADWEGDTLVLVPSAVSAALLRTGTPLAIQRERERVLVVARRWRAEFPSAAEPAEAVAISLEMLGNAAAIDTIRLARRLATSRANAFRIAAIEAVMQVKFAVPAGLTGLRAARSLADSLLAERELADVEPELLGSLAALTGHANRAASQAPLAGRDVPPSIAQSAPAMLAYAAMGGPIDSLRALETRVTAGIMGLPESVRPSERDRWLMRAAALAFPESRFAALSDRRAAAASSAAVVAAASARDSAAVRRLLNNISTARQHMRPADVTIDGVYPEAAALVAIGDERQAAAWIDPPLAALRLSATDELAKIARTGALLRTMVLRAELADRAGDAATARLWARAVVALWSGADQFLRPTLDKMERLAR